MLALSRRAPSAGTVPALLAILALLVAPAGPALGQPIGDDAFPRLAGGPPPEWVTPGLRLPWYGEAASVRTSHYIYVEDENGEWEDPVTHKRYRRTEENEMPTAAGRANTHTDVIAVDGDDVILATTMFGIDMETGQLSLIPLWGDRYAGAAVHRAWVRPDLLAGIAGGGTRELQVLRGSYRLGDQDVPAVAFLAKGEGTYASTVFDQASGALIATTGRAKGPGSPVHGPIDNPEGNVVIAWARLVDVRQRSMPGLGGPLPAWVHAGTTLRYTGTLTVTNPFDPYGFTASYPIDASVVIDETGPGWATYAGTSTLHLDGYPETTRSTGAIGAVGQHWYTPDGLARLEPGMVLDDEPVTGVRLTVEDVRPDGVLLRSEGQGLATAPPTTRHPARRSR